MNVTPEQTLRDVVTENPAAAAVLERLGIDYGSRGGRALLQVLAENGVSMEAFIAEVDQIECVGREQPRVPDWRVTSLRKLIRHIIGTHHAYLRVELPALDKWISKVAEQHPDECKLLLSLQRALQSFQRSLEIQMRKEETVLFPAISSLENADVAATPSCELLFGSVANLSRVMELENEAAAAALHEIRVLSNNYACPPDASGALKTLFEKLRILGADAQQHFHLENNILFPRAIRLERGEGCAIENRSFYAGWK